MTRISFKGRLIPALVVLIPLILASVTVLILTANREPSSILVVPDRNKDSRSDKVSSEESLSEDGSDEVSKELPQDEGEGHIRGRLYIVLDDVGYERDKLDLFLQLPIPITYAILPGLSATGESAEMIEEAGGVYILHQPMEPGGDQDPGPGAVLEKMEENEVRLVLEENLKQLPKARGINNHMGSKVTANPKVMKSVLSTLKERELYFLDSRTTADTVAAKIAGDIHIDFTERNVFLDNESSEEYIGKALDEGMRIAHERGYAVLIGHVWSEELYRVLSRRSGEIEEAGYRFAYIDELFERETADARTGD